jgi:RimJ/RimL family protein N-acetyltransferase
MPSNPTPPPTPLAFPPLDHTLLTARAVVRGFRAADAEALYATVVDSREHIARWLPWAYEHASVDDTRDLITRFQAEWQAGAACTYGIFARAPDESSGDQAGALLGGLGLHACQPAVPSFEIGYWLARQAEGHGYMTEATSALVDYALSALGARRVEIRCNARNTRSAAVARRLGFTQEALLHNERRALDGSLRDTLVFARWV